MFNLVTILQWELKISTLPIGNGNLGSTLSRSRRGRSGAGLEKARVLAV